eukprot:5053400-Alexandrium_andersonii.AAC.1
MSSSTPQLEAFGLTPTKGPSPVSVSMPVELRLARASCPCEGVRPEGMGIQRPGAPGPSMGERQKGSTSGLLWP